MSAIGPKQTSGWICQLMDLSRHGHEATLNFDHFGVVSLRIYDRNDYDRISPKADMGPCTAMSASGGKADMAKRRANHGHPRESFDRAASPYVS